MYQLSFYVPESHCESVKQALFAAGAGRYEHYDQTCWQVMGTGQFRPLEGANPTLGDIAQLEQVAEYRVEMICAPAVIQQVITALKQAHPYETPAYAVVELLKF